MRPVGCFQRFFAQGQHSQYIEVLSQPPLLSELASSPQVESIAEQIRGELSTLEDEQCLDDRRLYDSGRAKEVSPWLQLTRWPRYLAGYALRDLADLAALPPAPATSLILYVLCLSLDRLV
jgi:hypothetical protein